MFLIQNQHKNLDSAISLGYGAWEIYGRKNLSKDLKYEMSAVLWALCQILPKNEIFYSKPFITGATNK